MIPYKKFTLFLSFSLCLIYSCTVDDRSDFTPKSTNESINNEVIAISSLGPGDPCDDILESFSCATLFNLMLDQLYGAGPNDEGLIERFLNCPYSLPTTAPDCDVECSTQTSDFGNADEVYFNFIFGWPFECLNDDVFSVADQEAIATNIMNFASSHSPLCNGRRMQAVHYDIVWVSGSGGGYTLKLVVKYIFVCPPVFFDDSM